MLSKQSQYICCKTIPHIEVEKESSVVTSYHNVRFILIFDYEQERKWNNLILDSTMNLNYSIRRYNEKFLQGVNQIK